MKNEGAMIVSHSCTRRFMWLDLQGACCSSSDDCLERLDSFPQTVQPLSQYSAAHL